MFVVARGVWPPLQELPEEATNLCGRKRNPGGPIMEPPGEPPGPTAAVRYSSAAIDSPSFSNGKNHASEW